MTHTDVLRDRTAFAEPDIPDPPDLPGGIDYDRWTDRIKSNDRRPKMSNRAEHKFEFPASEIAEAARREAEYHRSRIDHWDGRAEIALSAVKGTIGAKVVEHEMTGGAKSVSIDIDYGDQSAWSEYQLAFRKAQTHREAAERYETDARVYGTQAERPYELDTSDVHHFRLGGQERES